MDSPDQDEDQPETRIARVVLPGPVFPEGGIPPLTEDQFAQVLELFKQQDPTRDWERPFEFPSGPVVQEPGQGPPYDLAERMAQLGAPDPDGWARSELSEDIPQEAHWLLIKLLWNRCIEFTTTQGNPHATALLSAGADPELLTKALKRASFDAMVSTLDQIDNETDFDAPPDAPGWRLVETRPSEHGARHPTGRQIAGLHESILQGDLTGGEGGDFLSWD